MRGESPDPIIAAARRHLEDSFTALSDAVATTPPHRLNERPAGPDTNSIAVLAIHAMSATRYLTALAVGAPAPERDRAGEFAADVSGPEPVLALIAAYAAEVLTTLDSVAEVSWDAIRHFVRGDGSRMEMTAAYALMHAVDHLRGHADEASLTRHVLNR